MYSAGNVLEDIAVGRAEHDLRALVDRAPRLAHRETGGAIEDVPIGDIAIGDRSWCAPARSFRLTVS
jgi:cation transport ATPase